MNFKSASIPRASKIWDPQSYNNVHRTAAMCSLAAMTLGRQALTPHSGQEERSPLKVTGCSRSKPWSKSWTRHVRPMRRAKPPRKLRQKLPQQRLSLSLRPSLPLQPKPLLRPPRWTKAGKHRCSDRLALNLEKRAWCSLYTKSQMRYLSIPNQTR